MNFTRLSIPDIILFKPKVFGDERGFFFESFNQRIFEEATGLKPTFVQDNHSRSQKSVLRGLHYQVPPKSQGKLVRVIQGEIFDVVVDIRKESKTFGRWVGERLNDENKHMLWIPQGFAHGFLTLSDSAEVLYKATDFYAPDLERTIAWDDPQISINWPIKTTPILSLKDRRGAFLSESQLLPLLSCD